MVPPYLPPHYDFPEAFQRGVAQFNQRDFYGCHDTLEALWAEAMEPQRTFYQGLLQMAVALYHLENQNWQGAVTLLGEGTRRLQPFQPDYGGLNLTLAIAQGQQLLRALQQGGPAGVGEILARIKGVNPQGSPPSLPYPTLQDWTP